MATATKNGKSNGKTTNRLQAEKKREIVIAAPNFETVQFTIVGTSPYVQHKFGAKAKSQMKAKQEAGSAAKKGAKREPKDFKQCYEEAQYKFPDGTNGLPATAFRSGMVSACRTVGFKMTHAKLGFFIMADGFDVDERVPLIKFTKGKPQYFEQVLKNETGVADIRVRPLWEPGWEAKVSVQFDADMFSADDIANLLSRAGMQVGIGEGRPDSRKCAGVGWGTYEVR